MRLSGVSSTRSMNTYACEDSPAGSPLPQSKEMPMFANILPARACAGMRTSGRRYALSRKYTVTFRPGWPACPTVPAIHAIRAFVTIVMLPPVVLALGAPTGGKNCNHADRNDGADGMDGGNGGA